VSHSNGTSWEISQNEEHPAGKAMLYATGMSDKQMNQPFVGIASCGYESNPCNMHLNDFAGLIKEATRGIWSDRFGF
jgi:dihydroxy-acid dehydratase